MTNRSLRPRDIPAAKRWVTGYVSRAQYRFFVRTSQTQKYRKGMAWDTAPIGFQNTGKKLARLPEHVFSRRKRK